MLFSFLLLLGILSVISNQYSTEKKKFEYIYYLSKILTIKNLIVNSHNSEVLVDFSSTGKPSGLQTNYKKLLKLVKNNECQQNYKPCGKLDTYGNLLCIDENYDCPINKMKVDLISKSNDYSSNNYDYTPLSNMTYNFRFFFSKKFTDGNCGVIIVKAEDDPKYITMSNFILDEETYKEVFGDMKLLEDIGNILGGDNNKNDNDDKKEKEGEEIIKIVQILSDVVDDIDLYIKGGHLIIYFLSYSFNKQIERFEKFIREKLEDLDDDKNIDKYFTHLGDNFYAKNYIGFNNIESINKFLKFDYNIYKKVFPNIKSCTIAIIALIFICIFIIYLIIIIFNFKYINACIIAIMVIIHFAISIGFFIYSFVTYFKVNKNKELEELKSIKSDDFINGFINEFVSKCKKSGLVLSTICITGVSLATLIISLIIFFKLAKKD